jgi:hypothetical protein
MERFWCYLAGFAITLALVAGFLIVKRSVEERRETQNRMMTRIAEDVYNERSKWISSYVRGLAVDVIDSKLAEKEGGA